jgi:ATP-dependent DNA helicase DinG
MAEMVFKSFIEESIALIEAGTGTGKTLAYLIPSVFCSFAFNEPVVISTKTINLQEQIMKKDIPLLREVLDDRFTAVLVKGWNNYLCMRRLRTLEVSDGIFSPDEYFFWRRLSAWAEKTTTGDKSDIEFEIHEKVWDQVCAESTVCSRRKCPYFAACFYFINREKMEKANILVTNHALLFTSLAMKRNNPENDSSIFPPFKRLIIDEAHHVEEVSSDFLGDEVSTGDLERILDNLYDRRGRKDEAGLLPRIRQHKFSPTLAAEIRNLTETHSIPALGNLKDAGTTFFMDLISSNHSDKDSDKIRLTQEWKLRLPGFIKESTEIFLKNLNKYIGHLEKLKNTAMPEAPEDYILELNGAVSRLRSFQDSLLRLWLMEDENSVYSMEYTNKQNFKFVRLKSYPLIVSDILYKELFTPLKTTVLASATLSINRNFKFVLEQLGLNKFEGNIINTKIFDSPFDFQKQAIMAIPIDMPSYDDDNFLPMVMPHLIKIIKIMEGRMFILFTSYKMLDQVYDILKEKLGNEGYSLFKQGELARHILLDNFKKTEKSILLGTDSFWEGVDVPGRSLECVVLMKLPFRVPTDPIFKARSDYLEKQGKRPFLHYYVPQAIIKFKQGFGRLIRNRSDRGVIITLDNRIIFKDYGKAFLTSLPKAKVLKGSFAAITEYIRKWQENS